MKCHTEYSPHNFLIVGIKIKHPIPKILIIENVVFISIGVCTNATAPSVSSINRILRNRAAERAAAEFARAASYGYINPQHPYASFPTWPTPLPTAQLWHPTSNQNVILDKTTDNKCSINRAHLDVSVAGTSPTSSGNETLGSPEANRMIGMYVCKHCS